MLRAPFLKMALTKLFTNVLLRHNPLRAII